MRLIETLDLPLSEGIFKLLVDKFEWLSDDEATDLNMYYYFGYSAQKEITPLYDTLLNKYTKIEAIQHLADIIYIKFSKNWDRLYTSYNLEYNPIYNYNVDDEIKNASKITSDSSNSASIYGFNSDDANPANDNHLQTVTEGLLDDNKTVQHKEGNIGVTTSQKMLSDELQLRKWNFFENIIKDIDSILCLKIYN